MFQCCSNSAASLARADKFSPTTARLGPLSNIVLILDPKYYR